MDKIKLCIILSEGRKKIIMFNYFAVAVLVLLFATFFISDVSAQTQSIEMNEDSVPADNEGPATTIEIPLFHNINNPNDNDFDPYYPELTATISFDNFPYSVSQATGTGNPPVVLGWRFNPEGELADGISTGVEEDMVVPFTALDESIDPVFNEYDISEMQGFYSSTEPTIGAGIDFTANRGAFIAASFEGLGGSGTPYESGARYHIADMTIEFNRPVTNPIFHFFGLGGVWQYDSEEPDFNFYINAGTVEFDLVTEGISLEVLSANPGGENEEFGLDVVVNNGTTQIINTWNIPEVIDTEDSEQDDSGVANGSIIVRGEDIQVITLRMFARAINDIDAARDAYATGAIPCLVEEGCYLGDSGFGWNGGATGEGGDEIPEYNIAHDLFILSISKEVQPDETTLTGDECFRMLSNPIAGTNLSEFLAPLWTQGPEDSDHSGSDFPNIFTWDIGSSANSGWQALTESVRLDQTELEPWEGFLMSVFADEFEADPYAEFVDFTLSVTGSEHPTDLLDFSSNAGETDGWILLGNPYKDPINISNFFQNSSGLGEYVYIWDRNYTSGIEDPELAAGDFGTWRVSTGSTGDIIDHIIAPFQGFFVQKNAQLSEVDFSNRDDIVASGGGQFYGKEAVTNTLRLEVKGESLYNYMWLEFSHDGDFNKTRGDAPALTPLSTEYAMFGSQKENGGMFTIGHFPTPSEDFEIPVAFESTRPGTFKITATDFNVSFSSDLYFIDLHNDKSIRIDENFRYEFTTNQAAAKPNSFELSCGVMNPQNAVAESGQRFMISSQPRDSQSEMPREVALNQNYPNPFNPTTQITYELPQHADVHLVVYDMLGREVATLVEGAVEAGVHSVNFDGANLSSGVYIYRLQAGNTVLSRKLTLIK
ncbi:MAG: T9SS type A sorting domain-containing protein [Balneolaceae bacterium]|nr:T9SS type A sorting domain-containing protein [Balneolaceae bacterium]